MKENLVSLAKLLAIDDAFTLAFSSRGTDEEKYELAKTKFTDLTREDFSEFLKKLREAEKANLAELSPDELKMVAGGVGSWATQLAAATILVTTLGAAGALSQQADASKTNPTIDISPETSTPQQTRRGGRSFASGVSIRAHAGPSRRGAAASSLSLRRLARRGGLELFQTQGHQPVGVTPSDQPTQPGMHPFIQNQAPARDLNIIRLGPPRNPSKLDASATRTTISMAITFNHGTKSAQEVLKEHHERNKADGSSSLIGELAQIVESHTVLTETAIKLGDITFQSGTSRNPEPLAKLGPKGTYNDIIDRMCENRVATKDTAIKILKNLSKPCKHPEHLIGTKITDGCFDYTFQYFDPSRNPDFNPNSIEDLANDLFEGLEGDQYKPARQLVAVLLCECIRFNDDGALVRWAMRNVISLFERDYGTAFDFVFKTDSGNPLPLAIFARPSSNELRSFGGKQQTLALILNDVPIDWDTIDLTSLINTFNAQLLEDTGEFFSGLEQSRMEEEPVDNDEDNDGKEDISYIPSAGQPGCQTN